MGGAITLVVSLPQYPAAAAPGGYCTTGKSISSICPSALKEMLLVKNSTSDVLRSALATAAVSSEPARSMASPKVQSAYH